MPEKLSEQEKEVRVAKSMLRHALSKDQTRLSLNNYAMIGPFLVATDGRRMGFVKIHTLGIDNADWNRDTPAQCIEPKAGGDLTRIKSTYPEVWHIIPQDNNGALTWDVNVISLHERMTQLDRVIRFKQKTGNIALHLERLDEVNKLDLSARNIDGWDDHEIVHQSILPESIDMPEEFEITMNAQYFLEMLTFLKRQGWTHIKIHADDGGRIYVNELTFKYILMGLRR